MRIITILAIALALAGCKGGKHGESRSVQRVHDSVQVFTIDHEGAEFVVFSRFNGGLYAIRKDWE